ncbi:MAG TPA: hypothetical protein PK400_12530, partial [Phycisphaerales bacterium]|nr:hypothetical protein [Phycisphaerales bacterium]
TVRDLLGRGASPAAMRLELIKTHYRSNANFTFQGLQDSQRMIDRWSRLRDWLVAHQNVRRAGASPLADGLAAFTAALSADVNVAGAIGALNEAAGAYSITSPPVDAAGATSTYAEDLAALDAMNSVLGVLDLQREGGACGDDAMKAEIAAKIAARNAARAAKDWAAADRARNDLLAMGIAIKDGPEGTTWSRIVQ